MNTRAEHAEANVGVELFEEMGGDQRGLIGADDAHIGPGQDVVDVAREIEADEERREERIERADQPLRAVR